MTTTSPSSAIPTSVPVPKRRAEGLTLTLSAIRNARTPLAAGCFYGALIAIIVGALYPTLSNIDLSAYLASPAFKGILGVSVSHLSGFTAFLGIELFSAIYGLLFGGIMAYIAGAALPVNIENGTLDLALSRPISRLRYYLETWLGVFIAGLILGLVIVFFVWIATFMVPSSQRDLDWGWLWIAQLTQFAFFTFAIGIGLLFGSVMNASRAAGGLAVGIIALGYLINTFGSISANISWLLKISPFYYAPTTDILLNHQLTWWYPIALALIGIACGIAGLVMFNKRDLPTV